jgi:polysaccharide pyruvyl transferase WcaK-like protein
MSPGRLTGKSERNVRGIPTVGLFGNLGSGNIGNDASLEAMLRYLRTDHPDVVLDAMCAGPEIVRRRYGIPAIPIRWQHRHERQASAAAAVALKAVGKGVDAVRIASWVRRHDVVIVPGMGVLETTLPLRPWQFPYDMFALCASGKIFRTRVALVSVGANVTDQRLTRWLFTAAARFASYRSYRDVLSRDAMSQQGLDTTKDHVYPDLAFSLPVSSASPGDSRTVGIGLMDYHGSNDDRGQAAEIHAAYVEKMKAFTRWLVDSGRKVRLFVGDTNNSDETVVQKIVTDLRAYRPDLDETAVAAEPISTFADLMRAMEPAGIVVATRYHNVVCALMLAKPTISIGYGAKNAALMAEMGLAGYCQAASSLDVSRLIGQFTDLESRAAQLRRTIAERNAAQQPIIERQLTELSAVLFQAAEPEPAGAGHRLADQDLR